MDWRYKLCLFGSGYWRKKTKNRRVCHKGQAENLAKKYFAVENPTAHPYTLLQIDNGFIKSIGTKKCDCAIANDKAICFVEFKANATKDTPSALRANYRKAMAQLSTTIDLFNAHYSSKGTDLKKLRKVEAYICFREGYPKSTSSQMNCKVRFMADFYSIQRNY